MASITQRATDLAANVFTSSVSVDAIRLLSPSFRRIELVGSSLDGVSAKVGDKVQLRTGGLTFRTYTPISVADGRLSFLAYGHGATTTPAALLLDSLRVGDELQVFGPRSSIDLGALGVAPIFVGDETSFGLAAAWVASVDETTAARAVLLFEVVDLVEAATVLDGLGIGAAQLAPSAVGGSDQLVERVVAALSAAPAAPLVLTGRAQTIKAIRARVKDEQLRPPTTIVKSYWDEHRAGLD
ncbi:hypothetical protein BH10ACT3_BH10ACT3_20990 [soil metagenome]